MARVRAELARMGAELAAMRGGLVTPSLPGTTPPAATTTAVAHAAAGNGLTGAPGQQAVTGPRPLPENGHAMPSLVSTTAVAGASEAEVHARQLQQTRTAEMERDARSIAVQNLHPMVDEGTLAAHFR